MPSRKRRQAAARKPTAKPGRPSKFTQALADEICRRMAEQGQTLRAICRDEAMPDKSTVLRWATADVAFRASYTLALAARADDWADEMLEIADEGRVRVRRDRLRVKMRRWLLARSAPKRYR